MDIVMKSLQQCKCEYEFIAHEKPILSAQEGAVYFQIEIGQTAPTFIIKADDQFFALILSGRRTRIDFKQIAKLIGCEQAQLAEKSEVKGKTGFAVGSVPLVGHALPCLLDKNLFSYAFVYGGSGLATRTLKISPQALLQVNQVIGFIE